MSTFITRSLSAIVFIVIMVGCIWWNIDSFRILFVLINIGCMYEYIRLMEKIIPGHHYNRLNRAALILTSTAIVCPFFIDTRTGFLLLLDIVLFISFILFFAIEIINKKFNVLTVISSLGGMIYIALPLSIINKFNIGSTQDGAFVHTRLIVLAILLLIWTNDTMAYISGALIGKTPFVPHISPKKTWEGIIGGIVCTTLIAWALQPLLAKHNVIFKPWWFIGPIASILATLGDLAESMLKRNAGVKDSGDILPGHGGFLDRFDAMLFTLPPLLVYVMASNSA